MSDFAPDQRITSTHRLSLVLAGGFTALATVLVRFGNYAGPTDTLMPFLPLALAVGFLMFDASRDDNPEDETTVEQEARPS